MLKGRNTGAILLAVVGAFALAGLAAAQEAPEDTLLLGSIEFPTSGSVAAQREFITGVLALHSFWYEEARDRFIDEGVGHDAAEISLELAIHFHREGRQAELDELRERVVPILQLRDVKQGVLAALILFKQAIQNGTATLEMLEELLDYVEDARPQS